MASRTELAADFKQLSSNANWRHYVEMLEAEFNLKVQSLLLSPTPDEVLRGEARALFTLLKNINSNNGGLTS